MPEDAVFTTDKTRARPAADERLAVADTPAPAQAQSRQALFAGTVELEVPAPVNLKMVLALYDGLQSISELRVLHTRGTVTRGTFITIVLEKPVPLVQILASKLPSVRIALEQPVADRHEDRFPLQTVGKKPVIRRITLTPNGI